VYSYCNICNIPDLLLQHSHETLQHAYKTPETLETSKEGRERELQPKKPAPGLATRDLVMSRAEVERRGGAGIDSGHDLVVGNGDVGSTSTQGGTGHGA
jgi:hypothetical protein